MSNALTIVKTADGSNTIFNSEVGENYHSRHGALQESRHVFLEAGLQHFLKNKKVSPLTSGGDLPRAAHSFSGGAEGVKVFVLEVGFGTGLNFLLSAGYCTAENIQLDYTGIEAYPLSTEMIGQTGYDQYIPPELWQHFISAYPNSLHRSIEINKTCQLQIAHCKLADFRSDKKYDVIYFDAFAAAYQPEMWNEAAITRTLQFLKPGGVFVTYAITGNLKRIIKALNLKVEKVPGAAGKREMLRAVKMI
jgi:tRNA U34 5-methylaminomethyl-2-thiouridine-forming methyltransferase MnmC